MLLLPFILFPIQSLTGDQGNLIVDMTMSYKQN